MQMAYCWEAMRVSQEDLEVIMGVAKHLPEA